MHLLLDELGGAKPATGEFPEHLRHLLPPPGTVFDVWFPEANPQAVAVAKQALQDRNGV